MVCYDVFTVQKRLHCSRTKLFSRYKEQKCYGASGTLQTGGWSITLLFVDPMLYWYSVNRVLPPQLSYINSIGGIYCGPLVTQTFSRYTQRLLHNRTHLWLWSTLFGQWFSTITRASGGYFAKHWGGGKVMVSVEKYCLFPRWSHTGG